MGSYQSRLVERAGSIRSEEKNPDSEALQEEKSE